MNVESLRHAVASMKRATTPSSLACALIAAIATLAIVSGSSTALAAGSRATVWRTQLLSFEPPVPAGPTRKGHCWNSIADLGRWRCMAKNEIYDPCFRVPDLFNVGHFGAVVCNADPFGERAPFVMILTQSLPEQAIHLGRWPWPWLVELADGTRCARMTGTLAAVDGEPVAFGCWQPSQAKKTSRWPAIGLFDDFSRGKVWTVTKVVFAPSKNSDKPFDLIDRKRVEVRTVWW